MKIIFKNIPPTLYKIIYLLMKINMVDLILPALKE